MHKLRTYEVNFGQTEPLANLKIATKRNWTATTLQGHFKIVWHNFTRMIASPLLSAIYERS